MEWVLCYNTDGYPRAVFDGNNNGKVHRVVWELFNGKSADGLVVRHHCDNPRCLNPEHLGIGSPADNVHDMDIRGRRGNAILTAAAVREIRTLYATGGYTQRQLGNMFGVNSRTINSLIKFKHWKHITCAGG